MKAKFIGDPLDQFSGAPSINMFGTVFPNGKWVDVKDAGLFAKLEGHSHFETQGGADDVAVADAKSEGIRTAAQAKREAREEAKRKAQDKNAPPDRQPVVAQG